MYLATTDAVATAKDKKKGKGDNATKGSGRKGRGRVTGPVLALGAVSLVTDISSEMVAAILPLYFVLGLGLSPLAFGFLDGLYNGATAFVRLLGGYAADRGGRHKLVAGSGYLLSALSRLGLLLAGGATAGIGAAIAADRLGKGVRTAPRDALISLSSPPDGLGRAFGVHRAMDTTGALLGPLAAFALLGFVVVVQPSASVLRAAVMGAVTLLAVVSHRRRQAIPALAATVVVLMIASPELAVDLGFALSVSATAALVKVSGAPSIARTTAACATAESEVTMDAVRQYYRQKR